MKRKILIALLVVCAAVDLLSAQEPSSSPIYVVYYWKARPGRLQEYSDYIKNVAEPIDREAQRAGVFQSVVTYVPAISSADWTHMRIFKLKNFAALDEFSRGLDEAGKRVFPDEGRRRENAARAAELRDLVRQEILRELP